ncbi:MAG: hypothetical protein ACTSU5_14700 [Promethearchaeota archaeon]
MDRLVGLCSEFAARKKLIKVEKLYRLACREIPVGGQLIREAIDDLIRRKVLVPGSYLYRGTILENPTRARVLAHVEANPGVTAYDVQKSLNLGTRSTALQLATLVKFGFLEEFALGKKTLFAKAGSDGRDVVINHLARKKREVAVLLKVLLEKVPFPDLTGRVGAKRTLLLYYLKNLEELEIVTSAKQGKSRTYWVTDEFQPAVSCLLVDSPTSRDPTTTS